MIYQLPSGKTIHISLEEYLNLTPEDIQYLISTGMGGSPTNPFYCSAIKNPTRSKDTDEDPHDTSVDYNQDTEEIEIEQDVNLDNLSDEDCFNN